MEVYCLQDKDGRLLDPSIQATVLAKYSRSPHSAREVVSSLSTEEANKFHSKWTITYGHSSVAELACIPVCFEGISMIASKFIEKFQRAGYSEKSTRYQRFSRNSFINPTERSVMTQFAHRFYDAYDRLHDPVLRHVSHIMGENDLNLPKVKARAFDNLRYLLPAGTGTNLAAVINLRDLRYMTSEALGHSNPEIVNIGRKLLQVGTDVAPALLGNVRPTSSPFKVLSVGKDVPTSPRVVYRGPDYDIDEKFIEMVESMYSTSFDEFSRQINERGVSHLPHIFRLFDVTLDVTMDYGAYRDLQRHRRCEQIPELLTTDYGYEIPEDILGTPLESEFRNIMESTLLYSDEENSPEITQYVIPMGFLHRTLFKMDISELYYISELRTKPQGHISYRKIAYQMFEEVQKRHPIIMQWCNAVFPEIVGDHL